LANFVVNFFTFTLLAKRRKTQYTFSLTLPRYNQTLETKIVQISISHYTSTFTSSFPTLHLFPPLSSNQTGPIQVSVCISG